MSLTVDGRKAVEIMVSSPDVFARIRPEQWSAAAINLAKKQLIAGKQTRSDYLKVREALGSAMFEQALDALKPMHLKQLAQRIDRGVDPEKIKTGAKALAHIREVLSDAWETPGAQLETAEVAPEAPKSNPYIGRKAFRTGR
ncbi:MAG: hypothetical protein AAFQ22_15705 [Pseudomonadota bacterium]